MKAHHDNPRPKKAKCQCWCGAKTVTVPWSWVGQLTASCGATDCQRPWSVKEVAA